MTEIHLLITVEAGILEDVEAFARLGDALLERSTRIRDLLGMPLGEYSIQEVEAAYDKYLYSKYDGTAFSVMSRDVVQ